MSCETFDVIVVGLGGMGSAACAHLAGRGMRVLGLEQFALGHHYGSSHGESRIIRKAYFEHPDYVPLLHRSYELWDQLSQETGRLLYRETGLLLSGRANGEAIPGAKRAASQHRLELESLSTETARRRFPDMCLPEEHEILFEPRAGLLYVESCVAAHLELARSRGADLRDQQAVLSITRQNDGVSLATAHSQFSAARLIVTAGAWTSELLNQFGIPLQVLRKFVGWFPVQPGSYDVNCGAPCFYIEQSDGAFYGFPSLDGGSIKVAEHTGGEPVSNPQSIDRQVAPADLARLLPFVTRIFPQSLPRLQRHSVCLYTVSPDHHFVIDRLPASPIVVACGFSGHGFKFASVVGEILADLTLAGKTSLPAQFLSLNRLTATTNPSS